MEIAICAPLDLHLIAAGLGRETAGLARGLGGTVIPPLILHLLDRGHQVTLYTLSWDIEAEQRHVWGNLRIFAGPAKHRHATRRLFRQEIAYLRETIRQDSPSFVNAHWTYEFALGSLTASVPTLVTIHDLPWNVLRYFRDAHRLVRLAMAYDVAARCRNYTAVSADAALHFRRYMRPGADIEIIPNLCDDHVLNSSPGLISPRDPLTFATVLQGWTRQKNAKTAIRAFQLLRSAHPAARLLMFGYGYGSGEEAHAWAIQEGLAAGISFRGVLPYRTLLEALSMEVDVLLHPSLNEAFSLTILDAMGLGKAVIAGTFTPGVSEMLNQNAGMPVDVRSPEKTAAAMRHLCEDRERLISLGQNARKKAAGEYCAARVVDAYERAYRNFATLLKAGT